MEGHRIQDFPHWDKVVDYESDESEVALLDADGNVLVEYDYCKFMGSDFKRFKEVAARSKTTQHHIEFASSGRGATKQEAQLNTKQ